VQSIPTYVLLLSTVLGVYLIYAGHLARGVNPDPKKANYQAKLEFKRGALKENLSESFKNLDPRKPSDLRQLMLKKAIVEKQKKLSLQIKNMYNYYRVEMYQDVRDNNEAVKNCLNYESLAKGVTDKKKIGDSLLGVYSDIDIDKHVAKVDVLHYTVYPTQVYIKLTRKYYSKILQILFRNKLLNFILLVLHEFVDFYFRVLEPAVFFNFKPYRYIVGPLRRFVGLSSEGEPTLLAAN